MSPDTMRVAQVPDPGAEFELVERELPDPGADEVRIAVEACGVCHSDSYTKEGDWDDIEYPRVPGHEVAGRIDATGADVDGWSRETRIGVGWHGYHCFACEACRRGEFIDCADERVTGIHTDGGYAEYMIAPVQALARIPDDLAAIEAAPLMCAGVSTFNALRKSGARPGDLAAVQGLGGLGHLGVQYASAAGLETVAISRGTAKREQAVDLGADHFVDATATDPAAALTDLGGAAVVLSTAPVSEAIESVIGGLGIEGTLIPLGVPDDEIGVDVVDLITNQRSIRGHSSGTARESQDTLEFSALRSITPMVETFPLQEAEEAYGRMMNHDVEYRAVLVP
jgi:D-arabinose 1-dehydrogenase-like Zn-dependent alcohol dehydrogenase